MARGKTKEQFLVEAKEIFGDTYEYIGEYIGFQKPMEIKCKKCGVFSQSPRNHLRSKGCPKCNNKKKKSFEVFYSEVKYKHGEKYTVNKGDFKGLQENVLVTCKKHGLFSIKAYNLLRAIGCKACAKESEKQKKIKNTNTFIQESIEIHGVFYIYPDEYMGANKKINIECPIHGIFSQTPSNHIRGRGCPKCGDIKTREKTKNTLEYFKHICNETHNYYYSYSKIKKYTNNKQHVEILCPKHGSFKQLAYIHMRGSGCPKCSAKISQPEIDICNLLSFYEVEYYTSDRKILNGLELDIVIPSKKIAIEYHGLMFHREGLISGGIGGVKDKHYHLNKTKLANEKGYKLIQIFEDEWINKKSIVKSKLKHILGVSESKKIYARKTQIRVIDSKTSKDFLNTNHIQSGDSARIRYGAFYNGELVGVMTFVKSKDKVYKLNRYATNSKYRCIGLASKLLTHFTRNNKVSKVITFADKRWTLSPEANLYTTIGFKLVGHTKPAYHYYNLNTQEIRRYNRQMFMKHKILKKHPDFSNEMTEKQMMIKLGYDRIWDCGNFKFEYNVQ